MGTTLRATTHKVSKVIAYFQQSIIVCFSLMNKIMGAAASGE